MLQSKMLKPILSQKKQLTWRNFNSPIITDYTVIRKVNQEKLKLSMIEGIEQCRRNDLISIKPIITLKNFYNQMQNK